MTCPYCGREMRQGSISGDGKCGVTWRAEKEWDGPEKARAAKLSLSPFEAETFYCDFCQKVTIEVEK